MARCAATHVPLYHAFSLTALTALTAPTPDIFARCQHTEALLPGDWSPSSVGALIGSVGHTVLFMAPWQSPEPLKRAWCCWEALCTLLCGGALELLCSGEASDALGEAMLACADEVFTGVLDSVDTKRSQASVRHDRKALHRAFAAERGDSSPFSACDGMLREPILAWLLAALRSVRASTGDSPDALRAAQRAARSVSVLAHAAVEPESWRSLAEGMLLEVHAALRGSQGATSSAAVDVVCDLCQLACLDAERDEKTRSAVRAEAVLRETLSLCETSDAATHDDALLLRWHLAGLLRSTGRVSDADELLVELLSVCRATHGNAHPATLHALHALALLRYQAQRRLSEAEELFAEEVQIRCGIGVGEDHTDKIHTLAACVCEDADDSDGDSWLARRPLCTCGHAACWQLANVLRDQGKLSDQELVEGHVPAATALLAFRMRVPAFQPSCACVTM